MPRDTDPVGRMVDLLRMERDRQRARIEELQAAIRRHRDSVSVVAQYRRDRDLWAVLEEPS